MGELDPGLLQVSLESLEMTSTDFLHPLFDSSFVYRRLWVKTKRSPGEHQNSLDLWMFTPLTLIMIGFDTHTNVWMWFMEHQWNINGCGLSSSKLKCPVQCYHPHGFAAICGDVLCQDINAYALPQKCACGHVGGQRQLPWLQYIDDH